MNYNQLFKISLVLFWSSMLISCANMVSPSGGERDIKAPKLLSAKPAANAIDVKTKKIELVFDEYLNLKDVQNQFIISPSNIEANVKKEGKKINIELSDYPKDNTTYILNFGNAISDYTEGNIAKDFSYIFSTGKDIDSLSLSGNVIDAYKLEPVKDVLVCLYTEVNNDSIVYKKKPDYTVRTNEQGVFRFTNLRENQYKLFVLKEENNNKIFDTDVEQIAFVDSTIKLDINKQLINIKLFKEIPTKRKLITKDISFQKVELIFNKENTIELINLNPKIDTVIYSSKKDSISIYYIENTDSSSLYLKENDKVDTINIKFAKSLKKRDLNISINSKIENNVITINSYDLFNINNSDSILLMEDSIPVKFILTRLAYNKFALLYAFQKDKKYQLQMGDSSFVSFVNTYSKKLKSNLNFINEEEYGTVNIKISNNKIIIYELINEKDEIIKRSINVTDNIIYSELKPGTYRLRMIYDTNKNNKWDTGNYMNKIQPEKVEYYETPIKIRANWDLELSVIP